MSADKKPKEPREHRDHDEPRSHPPGATGTLRVRVFGSEGPDRHEMVRRATVTLAAQGAKVEPPITGRTDESGEFVTEVPAGYWQATATAFGLTQSSGWEEVKPKCETCAEVSLNVNAEVELTAVETALLNEPRFYRAGTLIKARAESAVTQSNMGGVAFDWSVTGGSILEDRRAAGSEIHIDTPRAGRLEVAFTIIAGDGARTSSPGASLMIGPTPPLPVTGAFNVGLRRSASVVTPDLPLWVVIRNSTDGLSFKNYQRYIDMVLCDTDPAGLADGALVRTRDHFAELKRRRFLPFSDSDAYRLLKVATEAFVMVNCGVALNPRQTFDPEDLDVLIGRTGVDNLSMSRFEGLWERYLEQVNGTRLVTLPYLATIASKFPDARVKSRAFASFRDSDVPDQCAGLLGQKLSEPCLVELIWSYWHEEAMLVQSINAISLRFQNRRAHGDDPLANMELSPLRPLNNLLWGYIQDEQHRLSVMRRADEYDHGYGLRLVGRAARRYRTADSRVNFLRAFHNLLHLSADFFQKDDNTTVMADAFPVLNALKEVHLILSQGAHNQFGDLPVTARIEMLMQQWILARPEFADFLPTRAMVAYPEPWMDRVDAMKRVQGWSDVNVLHFRDLAVFGEQLLLTVRYGSWVDVNDPDQAKNWLRAWRPEIQGYIHAYRAVTGADVTAEVNTALPSALLQQRAAQQMRSRQYFGNSGY
jgi:hypothetical protein